MKATKQQIVEALRGLACWIDASNLNGEDICDLSIDGWGRATVHLMPEAFLSRATDVTGKLGHFYGISNGRQIVTYVKPIAAERQPIMEQIQRADGPLDLMAPKDREALNAAGEALVEGIVEAIGEEEVVK
ncbi:MAG: hypothetical protein L0Z50_20940 [Verrucomicrobiales bacterium]|nr:hypothetical protein [Verrucomicrobiales bacterium]